MILLRPTAYRITQNFGENPDLYPRTNGHMGIDYGTPEGSPIWAAGEGKVIFAGLDAETMQTATAGYGIHVKIQHPEGHQTIYGHLSTLAVAAGEWVRMGQVLGAAGNTGRSTAPHLHFELRTSPTQAVDPATYIVDKIPTRLMKGTITPAGDGLRVRSGPSTQRGVVRQLRTGQTLEIVGIEGADVWLRTPDGYVMLRPDWITLEQNEPRSEGMITPGPTARPDAPPKDLPTIT